MKIKAKIYEWIKTTQNALLIFTDLLSFFSWENQGKNVLKTEFMENRQAGVVWQWINQILSSSRACLEFNSVIYWMPVYCAIL